MFDVPFDERTSVLDALDWIKDHAEPGLTFRWSCRSGVCGSCGVMVNGRPVLSCETTVAGYRTSGLTVGPLENARVQRDLAVDTEGFVAKLREVKPWLLSDPDSSSIAPCSQNNDEGIARSPQGGVAAECSLPNDIEGCSLPMHTQTPQQAAMFADYSACINCLLCYSACPVLTEVPDFLGPAAIALARRWDLDSRDEGAATRAEILIENEFGIWPCNQNGACTRACPKDVDPARAIRDTQREALSG